MKNRLGSLGGLGAAPGGKPQRSMPQQRQVQQRQPGVCPTCERSLEEHDRVPPGALVQYYGDLSSGELPPEDMRVESLQYRVQIAPDGSINSESESVMLVSRYNFAFRRVIGSLLDPDFAGAAPGLVDFNIQEDGRNFKVFKTDMSMSALVNCSGSGNIAEWDGVYITVPGTQLSVTWSVDSRWATLVGATKEFVVTLIGDLVVCRGS